MQDTHLNHIGYNVGGIYGRSNSPPEADCKQALSNAAHGRLLRAFTTNQWLKNQGLISIKEQRVNTCPVEVDKRRWMA